MSLLDEVKTVQEAEAAAGLLRRSENEAREIKLASERFAAALGTGPDSIKVYGRSMETRNGHVHVSVRMEYDGVSFALAHGRHRELHVVLTCPTCDREFLSAATVYAFGGHGRAYAVARIANALEEPTQSTYAHQCEPNVLKPVRAAIWSAARTLGESPGYVANAALTVDERSL